MEHITGPFHGFWLACYTVEAPAGQVFAYAKLCVDRPGDVWATDSAVRKVCAGPFDDAQEAIRLLVEHTVARLAQRAAQASQWMPLQDGR